MNVHITSVCKAAYFHVRNIISQYLSEAAAQVIHAFVTSRLDYCNAVLGGLSEKSLLRLRRVQNYTVTDRERQRPIAGTINNMSVNKLRLRPETTNQEL